MALIASQNRWAVACIRKGAKRLFAVDDIDDTIARLLARGGELLGEVAQYESVFRLCYLRGPAGIIVALAEQIG